MRKYVILAKHGEDTGFVVEGSAMASNRETALRQFFVDDNAVDAIAVAVPERNWKPLPIRREVQTRLKIG